MSETAVLWMMIRFRRDNSSRKTQEFGRIWQAHFGYMVDLVQSCISAHQAHSRTLVIFEPLVRA